jgi:hypothetical protein
LRFWRGIHFGDERWRWR